jgi:photosystem II stability/assembly factor-like uncharacterized protein
MKDGDSLFNGRVNSIAVHPFNPNVIYLGSSSGGVWVTKDGGGTWTPLIDHEPMIAIGEPSAIAIDPSNTNVIYVGTSTRVNNTTGAEGASLNITAGILKSSDGGGSWIQLGSGFPAGNNGNASFFKGKDIFAIIVDPANSNNLYLASGNGLFFSTDAGQNWTTGVGGGGSAQSLALDTSSPVNGRVLFAAISSQGIKRSTDGGQTWTQVLSTATTAVANALATHNVASPPSTAGIGKVAVALAPPTSPPNANGVQVVYVTIEGVSGDFVGNPYTPILGIFQSTDQGTNWNLRSANAPSNLQCQCFYTNTIAVDPASPGDGLNDTVYWGGTNEFRSDDGGANFSDITNGVHADSHAWAFAPQGAGGSIVYTGNDGGIFRSTDKGGTWTGTGAGPATINAGGLQVNQMYHMDIKQDGTASVTLAAQQDNGTVKSTGSQQWDLTNGGDGLDVVFAKASPPDDAFSINNGGPNHSGDSGDSWSDITGDLPANQVQIFRNTMNVDPNNNGNLYFSGAATGGTSPVAGQLFQSTNGGTNWRAITSFTTISNVGPSAAAPANSNNVAVAVGSSVFVSTNGLASTVGPPSGVAFTNITRNLPNRAVSRIAFDPIDPTVIYAVLSGFDFQTPATPGHVFRTTIGGSSWANISPAVDVPFDGLAIDSASNPSTIYAGTDLGVVRSVDGGNSWTALDDVHFPNVPVTDLQINTQAGVLRASTYGRGAFEFGAASGPVISVNAQNGLDFGSTCEGSTSNLLIQVFNVGTTDLVINSVQRIFGSSNFSVLGNPRTPVTISPNSEVDFTVQYTAGTASDQATIRIVSNDPNAPFFDLTATGGGGLPQINATIVDSGTFRDTCAGSQSDLNLQIVNQGTCNLSISSIVTSNSTNFQLPSDTVYPIILSHDANITIPVRFKPNAIQACSDTAPRTGTVTVNSNDPNTPALQVNVSGTVHCPKLAFDPPNLGSLIDGRFAFPATVADPNANLSCYVDRTINMRNDGACPLIVTDVSAASANYFTVRTPAPTTSSPISIAPGLSQPVTVRFKPVVISGGTFVPDSQDGTLTVASNDPTAPDTTTLCGEPVQKSGERVLVINGSGAPIVGLDSFALSSKGLISNVNLFFRNLNPQTTTVCGNTVRYHIDRENLFPTNTTGSSPKSSYQNKAKEGNQSITQSFTLGQCEFKQTVMQIK